MRTIRLLAFIAALLGAAAVAWAATISLTLNELIASGIGDCTPSGPGQCNGTPPDPEIQINDTSGSWGNGLPFDQVRLPGASLGPVEVALPGSVSVPLGSSFQFLAGGTGGGSAGPDPGECPATGEGGVLTNFTLNRSITVNGTQYSFQQTGSIRVGWCLDVIIINPVSVPINTGQGTLTVNIAGSAPVASNVVTTISMTSPLAGATYTAPASVPLAATGEVLFGSITKVEFYRGATLVATVTSPPYTATDTGVAAGSYTYTARVYSDQEDPLTSVPASVTVSTATAQQQIYYIHPDHLNTPRVITNSAQQPVWRWDNVEPFGIIGPNENPSGLGNFTNNLRYPGQYFDKETNLHYNYFRDYDPAIGRYIQSDPIGLKGGINTYAYVQGNPLARIDPRGLQDKPGGSPSPGSGGFNNCRVIVEFPVVTVLIELPPVWLWYCVWKCQTSECPPKTVYESGTVATSSLMGCPRNPPPDLHK